MTWLLIVLAIAAAALLARIYFKLREVRAATLREDWDAKQIALLRSRGSDPFQPHEVDFFFGVPSEAACESVGRQLEAEGFTIDTKPVPEGVEQVISLHARKSLRLSVPDMQELSRRFRELALAHGGRYDGWTAGIVPQRPGGG
ncbi:MAG: ribonuclease E inhibitor RraB [Steroidobacteraceae bacterium]